MHELPPDQCARCGEPTSSALAVYEQAPQMGDTIVPPREVYTFCANCWLRARMGIEWALAGTDEGADPRDTELIYRGNIACAAAFDYERERWIWYQSGDLEERLEAYSEQHFGEDDYGTFYEWVHVAKPEPYVAPPRLSRAELTQLGLACAREGCDQPRGTGYDVCSAHGAWRGLVPSMAPFGITQEEAATRVANIKQAAAAARLPQNDPHNASPAVRCRAEHQRSPADARLGGFAIGHTVQYRCRLALGHDGLHEWVPLVPAPP